MRRPGESGPLPVALGCPNLPLWFTTFHGALFGTQNAPDFYGTCGVGSPSGPGLCHVGLYFSEELTNVGGVITIDSGFSAVEAIYELGKSDIFLSKSLINSIKFYM